MLDWSFAKKLSINYTFLANGAIIEKNLKVLLLKATKSFDDKIVGEIVSSINKNLGRSHSVVVRAWGH